MNQVPSAKRLFDRIVDYLAGAGATLVIAAMLMVSLEVVMRYMLRRPQIWVVEISEYSLVWLTFLGATWILRSEGHVKVDILFAFVSPRAQAFLGIVSSLIGVCVCLVLCIVGAKVVWGMFATWEVDPKSQIGMPKGPLLAIIPVCCLPLLVQFVRRGFSYVQAWKISKHQGGN